ncbi:period circadian protein isoform X3 [Thrips palmi]|uniref:Period circadian protein n=1 Tax=Thrips palmi TaxID=161013 RepID=A0A6P8Y7G0_THRPL|nr:period circadian protein isoform X3 [Thrips palmi]
MPSPQPGPSMTTSMASNMASSMDTSTNAAEPQAQCSAYISDEVTARSSDMEETDTNKTNQVSDSAYSTSCNSRSQRSSGSSKSRNSGSSNSSGYGGHASTLGSVTEFTQPATKRNKDKKKKGSRTSSTLPAPTIERSKEDEESTCIVGKVPEIQPEEAGSDNNGNASSLGLGPELVFGGIASPHDNEALQIAAINQTLSFIQKLKSSTEEPTISSETVEEREEEVPPSTSTTFPPTPEKTSRTKEEFTAIISMSDGIVKHTSTGIVDVLGFPIDMWVGRSITDFVQSKDRAAFASHITSGVASPLTQVDKDCGRRSPFFCCLRCYRGLKRSGFGVKDKAVQYRPCQLMLTFREHLNGFPLPEEPNFDHGDTVSNAATSSGAGREQPHIYLVVTVNPISSAYTYPEETQVLPKFATRLLASTHLSEVDPECVPYLGFLPQDMLGRSVLEFYHPEDMPFMKDVYEAVIKEQGIPFLSKPYRFRTQNGGYVLMETEWSSFSNPWSRKLEFIIAQHRVLKGPPNPDVFAAPPEGDTSAQMSEEVMKESKVIQEEIQNMLNEAMSNTTDNSKKRNLSKRCKVLASFMDSMLEEKKKPDLRLEVPPEEQSFSEQERDSVMLGEISPHHEYYDSKSSSETPPSYNQLNYNDNIQRQGFFESKPKTTRSDELSKEKSGSPGKNSPEQDSSLGSGDSGSGGGSGEMTGSHDSATSSSHNSYLQPMLTEALLTRHNENMEKRLVQRHREQRSKGDKRDKYHKAIPGAHANHGVKRIGSQSWENDSFKGSKHLHVENQGGAQTGQPPNPGTAAPVPVTDASVASIANIAPVVVTSCAATTTGNTSTTTIPPALTTSIPSMYQNSTNSVWPPFSVTVTPLPSSQVVGPFNSYPLVGGTHPHMMPMYYMGLGPQEHPGPPHIATRNPFLPAQAYMPTAPSPHLQLVYQPLPQSLLYSPLSMLHPAPTMLPTSLFPPGACLPTEPTQSNQSQSQAQASTRSVVGQTSQHGQQQQPLQPNQLLQSQQQQLQQQQQQHIFQQQNQQPQKPTNAESGSCHMQCKFQRPPSQATSVKAEPGSALGSVASASRRALSVSSNKNKSLSPCDNLSPDEDKVMEDSNQCSEQRGDEGSYYSSLCSYLCTDINSDESMRSCKDARHEEGCSCWSQNESISSDSNVASSKPRPVRSGPPPWMEGVSMTTDVIYGYQLDKKELDDVLSSDLLALAKIEQPALVNEQLNQLYQDLTIEGASPHLALEEGIISSSGSSSEEMQSTSQKIIKTKKKRRSLEYGRLIMIFEEDAPMPPPISTVATVAS